jgi:hypothetical protein
MAGISPIPVLIAGVGPDGPIIIPLINMENDNIDSDIVGIVTGNFGHTYNPISTEWDRQYSGNATADAMIPTAVGNTRVLSQNQGFNGATFDRLWSIGSNVDDVPPQTTGQQSVAAQLYGWNGASFDRVRLANISYTVIATASGATAVWTPAAGKRFRLLGYTIDVAGTLAATGVQTIELQDNATTFKNHLGHVIETTTASISGGADHMGADLGQGYLSTAVNNVLNINLSTTMATGGVAINVWGTEE